MKYIEHLLRRGGRLHKIPVMAPNSPYGLSQHKESMNKIISGKYMEYYSKIYK